MRSNSVIGNQRGVGSGVRSDSSAWAGGVVNKESRGGKTRKKKMAKISLTGIYTEFVAPFAYGLSTAPNTILSINVVNALAVSDALTLWKKSKRICRKCLFFSSYAPSSCANSIYNFCTNLQVSRLYD